MSSFILFTTFVPLAFAAGVYFGIQHAKGHYTRRSTVAIEGEVIEKKRSVR